MVMDKHLEEAGASRGRKRDGVKVQSRHRFFCEGERRDSFLANMGPTWEVEDGKEECRVQREGGLRERARRGTNSRKWREKWRRCSKP